MERLAAAVRAGGRLDTADCRGHVMCLVLLNVYRTDVRQVEDVMRRVHGVRPIQTIRKLT